MKTAVLSLAFVFLILVPAAAFSGEPAGPAYWPQWRGPSGQGYCDDTRVPLEWSESKNLLWKTKLPGAGHSTPIIWGDRLFLTSAKDNGQDRMIVCVRTTDGKILWQKSASKGGNPEAIHKTSSYASPSCATDGTFVYGFFGNAGLFCYDFEGKQIWQHNFGIFTSETGWGVGASPVLFEDLVIQNCDNDGPAFLPKGSNGKAAQESLIALDKKTGKVRWETPRNQGRSFSTPVLIPTPDGRVDLVLNGPQGFWGYDPKTGKELWHVFRHLDEEQTKFGEPVPVFNQTTLFAPAGRERGFFQAIKLGGNGDGTKSDLLWEVRRNGTRDVGSGVLVGDLLMYGDGRNGFITCHDAKTGKLYFQERSARKGEYYYASPILLQGKVLFLRNDGDTLVVEPDKTLKIVRENLLKDGTVFCASPAVADGRLFLRSQQYLYAIGTK
ncbi:MAG TPA: PQQ-binding-like beta-propeller repeat protein [Gemmataceae bacterium]|jgi:outer membrane protein assembly factor BamB|nr:PQQ-binding-like beta-propeller repeat protein [Gemmataceae bacterium]